MLSLSRTPGSPGLCIHLVFVGPIQLWWTPLLSSPFHTCWLIPNHPAVGFRPIPLLQPLDSFFWVTTCKHMKVVITNFCVIVTHLMSEVCRYFHKTKQNPSYCVASCTWCSLTNERQASLWCHKFAGEITTWVCVYLSTYLVHSAYTELFERSCWG